MNSSGELLQPQTGGFYIRGLFVIVLKTLLVSFVQISLQVTDLL